MRLACGTRSATGWTDRRRWTDGANGADDDCGSIGWGSSWMILREARFLRMRLH